jgi:hypothetical protein
VWFAFVGIDLGVVGALKKRWIVGAKGRARRRQLLLRWSGLAVLLGICPALDLVTVKSLGSTAGAIKSAGFLFLIGLGLLIPLMQFNGLQVDIARSERRTASDGPRTAWIDLGTRRRLAVGYYARRGRRHPDTFVAAIAESWADWFMLQGGSARRRRLAKRIKAALPQTSGNRRVI